MKDRYLFRAKRTDNGEWIVGYLFQMCHCKKIICPENEHIASPVDESTICQCTGLKDKNGQMIWENDIIRFQFDNDDCPFPNKGTRKRAGKVFFSDFRASWALSMGKNGSIYPNNDLFEYVQNGNRVEVIGNIFNHQKLLGM